MASGAKLTDNALHTCNTMRVVKNESDPSERIRLLRLGFNCDGNIDVIEKHRQKDLDGKDAFKVLQEKIKEMPCCFFFYDCNYETRETKKNELIFIFWSDDNCTAIKNKMILASSKDALKKSLSGIKHDIQINEQSAFQTRKAFAEAVGVQMTTLEGIALDP